MTEDARSGPSQRFARPLFLAGCSVILAVVGAVFADDHPASALELSVAGDETIVFDTVTDACDNSHLPDAPARAFRNDAGKMVLFAPNFRNRAFVGDDLDSLQKDCRSRFMAAGKADPGMLDDRTWLHAIYTDDGKNVYAFASASFMPYRHAMKCRAGDRRTDCWINGLVTLKSTDSGQSFQYQAAPPHHAPFPPPETYRDDRNNPPSYVTATNIVRWQGYLYSIVWRREATWQESRNCLVRAAEDDPSSWQIWDGQEFRDAARLTDAGWQVIATDCARIAPYGVTSIRGLIHHEGTNSFIAVYQHRRKIDGGGSERGIYYSTSDDLIDWSMPKQLMAADLKPDAGPGDPYISYPSLMDQDSTDRMFGTMDDDASLLFVRFRPVREGGKWTMTRQLVRVMVRIEN
ncbi:MAG: hypothetical protein ABID63_06490 [Pseudomonadota bacterium]